MSKHQKSPHPHPHPHPQGPPGVPQVWGRRTAQFYYDLQGKEVLIAVTTGKAFRGTLVGLDTYDLIIRQESGLEMLIPKGSVVYVHSRAA